MDTLTRRDVHLLVSGLLLFEASLVILFLLECALGSPFWFVRRLVDLDGEQSIAAWFSSIQLCAVGVVLLLKARRPGALAPLGRGFLAVLGLAFVFLSADEALSLHEALTAGLARYGWLPRFEGGHGIWITLYLAAGCAFLLVSISRLRFLWRHFRGPSVRVAGGLVVFVSGAVGVEVIGYGLAQAATLLQQSLAIACEEWLEMAGITLVLAGALGLWREEITPVPVAPEGRHPAQLG
ncbi:MAG: hypothetical protein M0R77_06845 [Gammaproteobacteria bacterium]|nr:hypothetical protein [Gammaproteobacteria bacterium]